MQDFAFTAEPLHTLTKKCLHFQWSEEHHAAFDKLKHMLKTAPIPGYLLNPDSMILDIDVSYVVAAVLTQVQKGRECVLTYGSSKMSKTDKTTAPQDENC